ncbi:MAG: DUF1508 domain-containing protein [Pseudomonadota bacterium]
MPKRYKSDAFEAAHEAAAALNKIGVVSDAEMRDFDERCLVPETAKRKAFGGRPSVPTFEVFKDAAAKWRWRLTGANGRTLATSAESFDTRKACLSAIEALRHLEEAAIIG